MRLVPVPEFCVEVLLGEIHIQVAAYGSMPLTACRQVNPAVPLQAPRRADRHFVITSSLVEPRPTRREPNCQLLQELLGLADVFQTQPVSSFEEEHTLVRIQGTLALPAPRQIVGVGKGSSETGPTYLRATLSECRRNVQAVYRCGGWKQLPRDLDHIVSDFLERPRSSSRRNYVHAD